MFEKSKNFIFNNPLFTKPLLKAVRVTYVHLDITDETKVKKYGGYNALGLIEYEDMSNDGNTENSENIAYPLYSNIKHYPLINETVFLVNLDSNNGDGKNKYYVDVVSLWNHPHHNALPPSSEMTQPEVINDYQLIAGAGLVRKIVDDPNIDNPENTGASGIYLGVTFKEKANIHPLLPFEGDTIYESRWGSSIRFGSTIINNFNQTEDYNWWSDNNDKAKSGDPITIIRNGQGNRDDQGWEPIVENIDIDNSSIYLTSTQKLSTVNERLFNEVGLGYNANSYNNSIIIPPISLQQYSNSQILLNSSRVVLNSTLDNIILNSQVGIHLSTPGSVGNINLDSNTTTIDSNFIYLGNQSTAIEPLVLGNRLLDVLRLLLNSISQMNDALSNAKTSIIIKGTYAYLPEINAVAKTTKPTLDEIKKLLGVSNENSVILSKTIFTKE